MSVRVWRTLVLIPWSILPLFLVGYLRVWSQLPARLVVHFDAEGRANGWMGRGAFLSFAAALLLSELTTFSIVLLHGSGSGTRPLFLVVAYYAVAAGAAALFWQLVEYNLHGTPIRWVSIAVATAAAAAIPAAALWWGSRGLTP